MSGALLTPDEIRDVRAGRRKITITIPPVEVEPYLPDVPCDFCGRPTPAYPAEGHVVVCCHRDACRTPVRYLAFRRVVPIAAQIFEYPKLDAATRVLGDAGDVLYHLEKAIAQRARLRPTD